MMYWLKKVFCPYSELKRLMDYRKECFEDELKIIKDDLHLLSKLAFKMDYKELFVRKSWCSSREESDKMEEEKRTELRESGYSFCHKKESGNEIWAKYN